MCAARVEVKRQGVIVKHGDIVLGEGPAVYKLRDFDPSKDIGVSPTPRSYSSLLLVFGERATAQVKTRRADTIVKRDIWTKPSGSGRPERVKGDFVLFGEEYEGWGQTNPETEIIDITGTVIALVKHLSSQCYGLN